MLSIVACGPFDIESSKTRSSHVSKRKSPDPDLNLRLRSDDSYKSSDSRRMLLPPVLFLGARTNNEEPG